MHGHKPSGKLPLLFARPAVPSQPAGVIASRPIPTYNFPYFSSIFAAAKSAACHKIRRSCPQYMFSVPG